MGFIKAILKEFDGSEELAQAQREAVQALSALGEAKAELFVREINSDLLTAGQGDNKTVPITSILASTYDVRAYSSTEAEKITSEVGNGLKPSWNRKNLDCSPRNRPSPL